MRDRAAERGGSASRITALPFAGRRSRLFLLRRLFVVEVAVGLDRARELQRRVAP